MQAIEYSRMAELEDTYWWHVGRKSIVSHQFKKLNLDNPYILNVGCGTGGIIPLLNQYGSVENIDVSDEAIKFCQRRGYSNISQVDGIDLPYHDETFDVAVATDVLEHIGEEKQALQEWWRVIKPGGYLILTLPAYQWLWSAHDESLHHHRRYTASDIHRKLNNIGFQVEKRSYAIAFSFPLIVGYRLLNSIVRGGRQDASYVMLPAPINRLFVGFLQVEARVLKHMNLPFGTSVLAIAQKPAE